MEASNAIVTFTPEGGERFPVTLPNGLEWKAGLSPDVNAIEINWQTWDANPGLAGTTGTLEFWFNNAPGDGEADAKFELLMVIDVEATEYGIVVANGPRRIVTYTLYLADRRQRLVSPRGGYLDIGKINPRDQDPTYENSELIELCLERMGFDPSIYSLDPDVDSRPAVRDLQWLGNHAPSELSRILDKIGAVFALQTDGSVRIDLVGKGPVPEVPADQQLGPDLNLPGLDRRGKTVVFSSRPNGIIQHATIGVPEQPDPWLRSIDWAYVIRDIAATTADGQPYGKQGDFDDPDYGKVIIQKDLKISKNFVAFKDSKTLGGFEPIQAYNDNFTKVFASFRGYISQHAYRFIRLNSQASILRGVKIGKDFTDITVRATVAELDPDTAQWKNVPMKVVGVVALYQDTDDGGLVNVIQFDQPLLKIDEESPDLSDPTWVELDQNDLQISCTMPEPQRNSQGQPTNAKNEPLGPGESPRPKYYEVGYRLDLGGVKKLSDEEVRTALADPETLVIGKPEWFPKKVNGRPVGFDDFDNQASELASRFLRGSGGPAKILTAVGFCHAELSGQTAEIKIDQQAVKTEIRLNTWFMPLSAVKLDDWRDLDSHGESFPAQVATAADQTAKGTPGGAQPVAAVVPTGNAGPAVSDRTVLLKITSTATGVEKYIARAWGMPVDAINRTTNLTAGDLGTDPGSDFPVIAENMAGIGRTVHSVPLNTFHLGTLRGQTTDNPSFRVAVFEAVPALTCFPVTLTSDGGSGGDATHAPSWTYKVSNLDGRQLATAKSPEMGRVLGLFEAATKGMAYYDVAGTLHLARADETEDTTSCPS